MTQKTQKPHNQAIFTIMTILSITVGSLQDSQCLVDQCSVCENYTEVTCSKCNTGYYLRTFYGKTKGKDYNDCWSTIKLLWSILGLVLLTLSCCLGLWLAYKYGKKNRAQASNKNEKKFATPKRYSEGALSDAPTVGNETSRKFISPQSKPVRAIDAPSADFGSQPLSRSPSGGRLKTLPPIRRYGNKENIPSMANLQSSPGINGKPFKNNSPGSPGSPSRRVVYSQPNTRTQQNFGSPTNTATQYVPSNQANVSNNNMPVREVQRIPATSNSPEREIIRLPPQSRPAQSQMISRGMNSRQLSTGQLTESSQFGQRQVIGGGNPRVLVRNGNNLGRRVMVSPGRLNQSSMQQLPENANIRRMF